MWCCVQHDAQMDYYGKRLATCSSDRTVRIFEVVENTQNLVASLPGWALHYTHTHTHTHSTCSRFTAVMKVQCGRWTGLIQSLVVS